MIGPLRTGVDPPGHAVLQHEPGSLGGARGMRMDIDQARDDELAARIDAVSGVTRDVRLDGGDPPSRDRHVADGVEPDRGIDDTSAPDNQVIPGPLRRECSRCAREHRRARGRC